MNRTGLLLIFILLATGLFSQNESFSFSLQEGVYSEDQKLFITASSVDPHLYYSFYEAGPYYTYQEPLQLTAVQGERRQYHLYLKKNRDDLNPIQQKQFVIDKSIPREPVPLLPSGTYWGDQKITFEEEPLGILYSLNSRDSISYLKRGESLVLKAPEEGQERYELLVYTSTNTGAQSDYVKLDYTLKAPPTIEDFKVLSPVQGDFVNNQLLYLDSTPFQWVRYTTDGTDPRQRGIPYRGPVLLQETGLVKLRIAAQPRGQERVLTKEILYKVNTAIEEEVPFKSGLFTEDIPLDMSSIEGEIFYNFTDAGESFVRYNKELNLVAKKGSVYLTPFTFRVQKSDGRFGPFHRYFFIIDKRSLAPPGIRITQSSETQQLITLSAHPSAQIFYRFDSGEFNLYSQPLLRDQPQQEETLEVYAAFPQGKTSPREKRTLSPRATTSRNDLLQWIKQEQGVYRLQPAEEGALPVSLRLYGQNYDSGEIPFTGGLNFDIPLGYKLDLRYTATIRGAEGDFKSEGVLQGANQPHNPPVISILDKRVSLSGEGKLYLRVYDGQRNKNYAYSEPFPLTTQPGEVKEYRISAFSVDSTGDKSPFTPQQIVTIDERKPGLEAIQGVEDGQIYNQGQLKMLLNPAGSNSRIRYTYSDDGTEPPVPTLSSTLYNQPLTINTQAGEDRGYWFKVKVYREGFEPSNVRDIRFRVDRQPPGLPLSSSRANKLVTNRDYALSFEEQNENDLIFYTISTEDQDTLSNPLEAGKLYQNPIQLEGEAGRNITYYVRVGVRDTAGNTQSQQGLYQVTIDRTLPLMPVADIREESRKTIITLASTEGGQIFYRFPSISEEFLSYTQPIEIPHKEGIISYRTLEGYVQESSGNKSPLLKKTPITIDGRYPQPVSSPDIIRLGDNIGLSLKARPDQKIYYRIQKETENNPFIPYGETLIFTKEEILNKVLQVYSEAPSQRRGDIQEFIINADSLGANLPLKGIKSGETYRDQVVLQPTNDLVYFRYELSSSEIQSIGVTQYSPMLKEPLVIDVNPGEVKDFTLRIKAYLKEGDKPFSEERTLRFTIDKLPPPIPVVEGIEDDGIYSQEVRIQLKGSGQVHYNLENLMTGETESRIYQEPFYVNVGKGIIQEYRLSTYSVDSAGNESETRVLDFSIDRAIVYISSAGEDENSGTRTSPVRTIDRGMEILRETGKSALFLSAGDFAINQALEIGEEELLIQGGMDPQNWRRETGISRIYLGPYFPQSQQLFRIEKGTLTLSQVDLSLYDNRLQGLITNQQGTLLLRDFEYLDNAFSLEFFLKGEGGRLEIENSRFEVFQLQSNPLITWNQGEVDISSSQFSVNKSRYWTLFDLTKVGELRINLSRFNGNNSGSGQFINLSSSDAFVDQSRFVQTDSEGIINFIKSRGSQLVFNNNLFMGEGVSNLTSLNMDSGSALFRENQFYAKDIMNLRFLNISQGDLKMDRCSFLGGSDVDYLSLIYSNNSNIEMTNSFVNIQNAKNISFARLRSGQARFTHNTMVFTGSDKVLGIDIQLGNSLRFTNNLFMTQGASGVAFKSDSYFRNPKVQGNNLFGWSRLLQDLSGEDFSLAEGLNRYDGDPFKGNISKNIQESFSSTFQSLSSKDSIFRVKEDSKTIDGGILEIDNIPSDWDGQVRPSPQGKGLPDMGADEYYR